MSTQEEKAWASALATKYGIREPVAPESPWALGEALGAFEAVAAWTTTGGPTPATTATA